jgi:phenylacetic acid degradation operon negative regulatory protein
VLRRSATHSANSHMSDREDLEARTGSSTALLRTVVGSVLRPLGGWMTASGAVGLLGALDVPASTARSSLVRLCSGGVLMREPRDGVAGYALDPAAVPMLERGDRRIFDRRIFERRPAEADGWCLVSFSIPERQRDRRHQLRRRLAALGCGSVADGLWIAPQHLEDEVDRMLAELGLQSETVLFTDARTRGSLSGALQRWYDLDRIRAAHDGFLRQFGDAAAPSDDRAAFARWIRVLDEWRVIPYLDPGLPASALPGDWPAAASAALFAALRSALEPRALAHARSAAL